MISVSKHRKRAATGSYFLTLPHSRWLASWELSLPRRGMITSIKYHILNVRKFVYQCFWSWSPIAIYPDVLILPKSIELLQAHGILFNTIDRPAPRRWTYLHCYCIITYWFAVKITGNLLKSVGQNGNGPGEFKEPAFVCIGRDDDIIISDCRNSRVQVLNKDGEFKYQIGAKGSGKGQLQGPSGVTTDKYGHILVTDRVNNRLQVCLFGWLVQLH